MKVRTPVRRLVWFSTVYFVVTAIISAECVCFAVLASGKPERLDGATVAVGLLFGGGAAFAGLVPRLAPDESDPRARLIRLVRIVVPVVVFITVFVNR